MEEPLQKIESLPQELQEKKEIILHTAKSYIKISLRQADDMASVASKVGGTPYLPTTETYPLDKNGRPMEFLAQINFGEMPALEGYPAKGLLQFFIGFENWGMDDDAPLKSDFKVIYRDNFDEEAQMDFSLLGEHRKHETSPIGESALMMSFSGPMAEVAPSRDYRSYNEVDGRFRHYLNFDEYGERRGEELEMAYWNTFSSFGHKIGGYADFTQQDPRFYEHQDFSELLFQLDSDSSGDILWGDNGIAISSYDKKIYKTKTFQRFCITGIVISKNTTGP